MIIHCTETLKVYNEDDEKQLLKEMGVAGWTVACVSILNKIDSDAFSAKYYFHKVIQDY